MADDEGAAQAAIEISREKLAAARKELTVAQEELDSVLSKLRVAPRAEKTVVSDVIVDALERRRNLVAAETALETAAAVTQ